LASTTGTSSRRHCRIRFGHTSVSIRMQVRGSKWRMKRATSSGMS
jgi:hypothetical protein